MANILDRIASETDLTKSERKLAGLILKDPVRVINETIADLAKRADVSEPTVFRFCKRFGAEGFPAFKLVLSSIANSEQLSPVESVKSGDSVGDVIKKSISSVKHQLSVLEHNLDEALIARVIDVVSQSRRLVILASGLSSVAGSEFSLRMLNLGFACEYYADPQLAATALVTLNSSDVVIAFSATGKNQSVIDEAMRVKNTGAALISVCPDSSELVDISLLHISTGDGIDFRDDAYFDSRCNLLLTVQIIVSGVSLRRGLALKGYKDRLATTRKLFHEKKESEVNETADTVVAEDDRTTKPGAPITTLDWHPY